MIKNKCDKEVSLRFISKILIFLLILLNIKIITNKNNIIASAVEVYKPISISGFNSDVIAENLTEGFWNDSAVNYTNTTMDYNSYVLYSKSVADKYLKGTGGLPDNRILNSQVSANVQYELQPYTSNNVARISDTIPKVTLNFSSSEKFEKLYFLTMCTDGTTYCDLTITFTDGTVSDYMWHETSFTIEDCKTASNAAVTNIGFINRSNSNTIQSGLRMGECVVNIRKEHQSKIIKSIEIDSNMLKGQTIRAGIFAVTGKYQSVNPGEPEIPDVPDKPEIPVTKPNAPTLKDVTYISGKNAMLNWNAISNADEYLVEVATKENFLPSSILSSYNNISVENTSLYLSGLKTYTTYYYRVRAKNKAGTSGYSAIEKFRTSLNYAEITRQPDPLTIVEENDINKTLSVQASSNSWLSLNYTWYLCRDEMGKDVIKKENGSTTYTIPTNLTQGEYYVYCEVYNSSVNPVKSNVAKIIVQVIYKFDLSWGDMKFDFSASGKWDPEEHAYVGGDSSGWNIDNLNGENNKISISNHSSSSLRVTIEYKQNEGAFNEVIDENTSVQGRLYKTNADAIKASKYLDNLKQQLTFGNKLIDETLQTDKWSANQNSVSRIYFAFSGMPDLNLNNDSDSSINDHKPVGSIQIRFITN